MPKKAQVPPTIHDTEDAARSKIEGRQKIYKLKVGENTYFVDSHNRESATFAVLVGKLGGSVEPVRMKAAAGKRGGPKGPRVNPARVVLVANIQKIEADPANLQNAFAQNMLSELKAQLRQLDDELAAKAAKKAASAADAPVPAAAPTAPGAVPVPPVPVL